MTDTDDHANISNPCIGICAMDENGFCVGCLRTDDERSQWYIETTEWRETVLKEIEKREEAMFGGNNV
jgi:predicted Fe-S protein YdhL (DUF1289 family)